MPSYSYQCSTRIEMGIGKARQLAKLMDGLPGGPGVSAAPTVLVVSDPGVVQIGLVNPILNDLESAGIKVTVFQDIVQNPRDVDCVRGAAYFREVGADLVIAIGGGSAMDTGKAIALLGRSGGEPADYVDGRRSYGDMAPVVCVPTTAGTGSEVTRSAVITETGTHRKMTLKHAALRPVLAVLDAELTLSLPPSVTAATGVDALVHAIEGYTCKVTNPISQALGARAMETIVANLPLVYRDGRNVAAREAMLEGSMLAGLCFGSADVAAVHCLAEALGGLYDTPHGVANAVFLPHVLRFNAETEHRVHATVARIMHFARESDSDELAVERLVNGIGRLTESLGIPQLRLLPGVSEADFDRLVELAVQNGSTPSNVRSITAADYRRVLEAAYR